jgi:membrane protease YdiL (CAAX protease family)
MTSPSITSIFEEEETTKQIPQYNLWMILWMFIWPAAWFMFLIHVLAPLFWTPEPGTFLPTWIFLAVAILGNGAELVVALVLLRREGYPLTLSGLRERARLRWPQGWKKWLWAIGAMVLVIILSMLLGPVSQTVATIPGFIPPDWWPAISNPNAGATTVQEMFPDVTIAGNYLFFIILFFVYGLIFNTIGEELYYRSFLLPKMRAVFGRWDWVANGVLFALKHFYQRWIYIGLLPGGLALAFVGGPIGSVYLSTVGHWIANYALLLVLSIPAIFGGG